jgi:PAS domain S-box-containing protein
MVDRLKAENKRLKEKLAAMRKDNQALQKSLKDGHRLFKDIPGAVVLIQGEKVILANEMAMKQLGYANEEVLGQNFLDFVHPDSVDYVSNLHKKRLLGRSVPDQYETCLATRSGESFFCEIRVKKIRHQGRMAFLFVIIGLGQRKQREMRLSRALKVEALTRVSSVLSREFNDCLSSLKKCSMLLKSERPLPEIGLAEFLGGMDTVMEKGGSITQKLTSLAEIRHEGSDAVLFDLKKVVQDAVDLTRPKWKEDPEGGSGRISLKTYLRALSPVEGRPEEIRDALVAMVLNAVDALPPEGGEIFLTTEENSGLAHVYIQDNGTGIPDNLIDNIFDPFFTTKGESWRGLGLSTAYAIMDRHRGEIEVMSQEGQGTIFTLKLPLAQKSSLSRATRAKKGLKDSHILIIADEGMVKELLSQLLESKGGRVSAVSTGAEVLKMLSKDKFDLVIADPNTADLNSSFIIPKIKKKEKNLPIALVNVEMKGNSCRTLKELGADMIIGRPLEVHRILPLVSKAFVK